ncbi:Cytosolic Fe-S cluster assembly factor nar1 [Malassezia caprae]|uniref:Cytosolic Fe-S cluster assembly factor NAR1 n=1 Tax=Malassezia caprae TaxID=1381934 RepID=A0AAF0E876_9BASI|nr:Cytosolic Fe-S cluster assembly factor nar1 [Malassezia caprae]
MAFSGALTLTDLNDYLGPSQVCIKPVEAPEMQPNDAQTNVSVENGVYVETSTGSSRARTTLETAHISLNDCLACSGCVTSAETVLIGMQSVEEVRQELQRKGDRVFIATISAQTIASLQTRLGKPYAALWPQICHVMRRMGFDLVLDTSLARHLALRAHVREFRERKAAKMHGAEGHPTLPMLASACPGWVCYAEKAHSALLPFVAATKSPQQMAGLLAKRVYGPEHAGASLSDSLPAPAAGVYHVSVMPCYDKKLEASRNDFTSPDGVKEVDCVLTTGELHDLLVEHNFEAYVPTEQELAAPRPLPEPGSSSGGYLFAILMDVYQTWMKEHPSSTPALEQRTIRSSDYTEYLLRAETGEVLFKGAICYGFRNLQNLVRKLQRETGVKNTRMGRGLNRRGMDEPPYEYIEVMACPGGCVNGGGQMRPDPAWKAAQEAEQAQAIQEGAPVQGWQGTDRRWVQLVEDAYWDGSAPSDNVLGKIKEALSPSALRTWLRVLDENAATMERSLSDSDFRTQYHGVEAPTNGLAVQW